MKRHHTILVILFLIALPVTVVSQIPKTLSYQGVLTDSLGNPKPDGIYTFTFRLYTTPAPGSPVWTEVKDLDVQNGLFSTQLGDVTPFAPAVRFDSSYWLGIKPGSASELVPLVPLGSVAYSMNSVKAETAAYAMAAPAVPFVDSARIAGTLPADASLEITSLKVSNSGGVGIVTALDRFHVADSLGVGIPGSRAGSVSFYPPDGSAWMHIDNPGTPGRLRFSHGDSPGVNDVMTINQNGSVGIGTSAPSRTLHISDDVNGIMGLRIENTNAGTQAQQRLEFGTGQAGMMLFNPSYGSGALADRLRIYNNTSGGSYDFITGGQVRMTIANNGKVGLGPDDPSSQVLLHLSAGTGHGGGASDLGSIGFDSDGAFGIKWVDGSVMRAHIFRFSVNGRIYVTNKGLQNTTGVWLDSAGTAWVSSSDKRMKENMRETAYGLNTLLQIPVKEYNFKGSPDRKIGFVAQDIYPIIPEIVSKGDDGELTKSSSNWGIDYSGLTPILVKAIQEQQQQIEEYRLQVETLTQRLLELEARLR